MSEPAPVAERQIRRGRFEQIALLAVTFGLLLVTSIDPFDHVTWWLEVSPVLIAIPILVATASRFRLSPLLYRLIFFHAVVLIVGGYYTYSLVPIGQWAQDAFGLSRNHYDRFGHFVQGFVPAIAAREILLRRTPLTRGAWLSFLIVCVCLAISAAYELVEFMVAIIAGGASQSFLGTQGDVWDAQWDMLIALAGAILALVILAGAHERSMAGRQQARSDRQKTRGDA